MNLIDFKMIDSVNAMAQSSLEKTPSGTTMHQKEVQVNASCQASNDIVPTMTPPLPMPMPFLPEELVSSDRLSSAGKD